MAAPGVERPRRSPDVSTPLIEIKDLKSLADEGKKQLGSGVVALVATSEDGKASIVVGVTPDFNMRELISRLPITGHPNSLRTSRGRQNGTAATRSTTSGSAT